jgi:hypothetical protein
MNERLEMGESEALNRRIMLAYRGDWLMDFRRRYPIVGADGDGGASKTSTMSHAMAGFNWSIGAQTSGSGHHIPFPYVRDIRFGGIF